MSDNEKYYSILGLEEGASQIEIKNSFRRLSLIYHPDINKETGSKEKMDEIIEANNILFNPDFYQELLKEIKKDSISFRRLCAKYPFACVGEKIPKGITRPTIETKSINNINHDYDFSKFDYPENILENASAIYRKAIANINYKSPQEIAAASLYMACRYCNAPRALNEISEETGVSKQYIGRTYRLISRKLDIQLQPTSAVDYVPRFAEKLNLSEPCRDKAIEILESAYEKGLPRHEYPTGYAGAVLYIASVLFNERKTQREVAMISGVTEVTIRNRYHDLTKVLEVRT